MFLDDLFHDGQADACALEFVSRVQALKYPEKSVCLVHAETDSVVPDEEHNTTVFGFRS